MPLQQQFADFVNLILLEDFSGKKSPVLSRLEFLCLYRFASFDPEYAFSSVGPLTGEDKSTASRLHSRCPVLPIPLCIRLLRAAAQHNYPNGLPQAAHGGAHSLAAQPEHPASTSTPSAKAEQADASSLGKRRRSSAAATKAPIQSREEVLEAWRADAWAPVAGSPPFMGCFTLPGLDLEFCDLVAPCPNHPSGAFRCSLCSGEGDGYAALGEWGSLSKAGRHLAARSQAVEGATSGASRHYKGHMQRLWDLRLGARLALEASSAQQKRAKVLLKKLPWPANTPKAVRVQPPAEGPAAPQQLIPPAPPVRAPAQPNPRPLPQAARPPPARPQPPARSAPAAPPPGQPPRPQPPKPQAPKPPQPARTAPQSHPAALPPARPQAAQAPRPQAPKPPATAARSAPLPAPQQPQPAKKPRRRRRAPSPEYPRDPIPPVPKPPPIKWNIYTNPEILDEAMAQPNMVMIHSSAYAEGSASSAAEAASATERAQKRQRHSKTASSSQPAASSKPEPAAESIQPPAEGPVQGAAQTSQQWQGNDASQEMGRGQGKQRKAKKEWDPWEMMPPIPGHRTHRPYVYHHGR